MFSICFFEAQANIFLKWIPPKKTSPQPKNTSHFKPKMKNTFKIHYQTYSNYHDQDVKARVAVNLWRSWRGFPFFDAKFSCPVSSIGWKEDKVIKKSGFEL
jgi:hypothetical protein